MSSVGITTAANGGDASLTPKDELDLIDVVAAMLRGSE